MLQHTLRKHVRVNFAQKKKYACGQHEVQYTEWRMSNYTNSLTCVIFLYIMCNENITGKIIKQLYSLHRLGYRYFYHSFTK